MMIYAPPNGPGWLGKLLTTLVGTLALIAALMFSAVLLAAAMCVGLMAWGYFWWKTRELRRAMREHPPGGQVIEGEAVVVDEAKTADARRVDSRDS